MKTFCVSLMALVAAPLYVLAAHASLSTPNTHPTAHEGMKCQQSNGVKVCPPAMEAANTETPPASTVGVRALSVQTDRGCKYFHA